MKRFALALLPALFAACAPFPATVKESDLVWTQLTVSRAPTQVYRAVMERSRQCGYLVDTIEPQGDALPDPQELVIDLYLHGDLYPTVRTEIGRLRLTPAAGGTQVRVGITANLNRGTREEEDRSVRAVLADPSLPCNYAG
jgi:hypothetical protein